MLGVAAATRPPFVDEMAGFSLCYLIVISVLWVFPLSRLHINFGDLKVMLSIDKFD